MTAKRCWKLRTMAWEFPPNRCQKFSNDFIAWMTRGRGHKAARDLGFRLSGLFARRTTDAWKLGAVRARVARFAWNFPSQRLRSATTAMANIMHTENYHARSTGAPRLRRFIVRSSDTFQKSVSGDKSERRSAVNIGPGSQI